MTLVRVLSFGAIVCIASWTGFATAAGNVGLQQSISRDPVFFATTYPLAIVVSLAAAFTTALILARMQRAPRSFALYGALAVLSGDVVASFLVAPVVIGELEVQHGLIVLLAISQLGLQVVAAWLGALWGAERTVAGDRAGTVHLR